jgi:uncharacterized protein YjbJ (UPF0337 family)
MAVTPAARRNTPAYRMRISGRAPELSSPFSDVHCQGQSIGEKVKRKINERSRPRSTSRIPINTDSSLVKSSTKDKIKGRIDEAKGKVKEKSGKAAGDSDLRDRGTAEKAGGKIQRKIGDVKKVFEK